METPHPKDPAVLKILRDSELLRRSVPLRPPYAVNPSLGEKRLQNPRKLCQRDGKLTMRIRAGKNHNSHRHDRI